MPEQTAAERIEEHITNAAVVPEDREVSNIVTFDTLSYGQALILVKALGEGLIIGENFDYEGDEDDPNSATAYAVEQAVTDFDAETIEAYVLYHETLGTPFEMAEDDFAESKIRDAFRGSWSSTGGWAREMFADNLRERMYGLTEETHDEGRQQKNSEKVREAFEETMKEVDAIADWETRGRLLADEWTIIELGDTAYVFWKN